VTRCVALVGQHGATRSSRQARLARHVFRGVSTAWTGVNMSISLFPEVVPKTDAHLEHKRLNLYTRALMLLRRPPCWNKHGSTRSSRHAQHAVPVVSCDVTWRAKWNFGFTVCGLCWWQDLVRNISTAEVIITRAQSLLSKFTQDTPDTAELSSADLRNFVSDVLELPEVNVIGAARAPLGVVLHRLFVASHKVSKWVCVFVAQLWRNLPSDLIETKKIDSNIIIVGTYYAGVLVAVNREWFHE